MAGVKGTKPFVEEEFKTIKKLLDISELTRGEVCRITKRSHSVVSYVEQAKDFGDYKRLIRLRERGHEQRRATREAPPDNIYIDKGDYLNLPKSITNSNDQKILTSLESIADSLAAIASHFNNQAPLTREAKEFKLFGRK